MEETPQHDIESPEEDGVGGGGKGGLIVAGGAAVALVTALVVSFIGIFFAVVVLANPIGALVSIGSQVFGLFGLGNKDGEALLAQIPQDLKDALKDNAELQDLIRYSYDCSSLDPAERQPGVNCVEGALYSGSGTWSAIPASRAWMVPVWKAAARRYNVSWEVLAAINGARTSFGMRYCGASGGKGFYQISDGAWGANALEAGTSERSSTSSSGSCYRAEPPARVFDDMKNDLDSLSKIKREPRGNTTRRSRGNPWDPVDSTFVTASMLSRSGSFGKKDWSKSYKGKGPDNCTPNKDDGDISYPPTPPTLSGSGVIGYNKFLKIPRWAGELASRYRSNKGKWRPRASLGVASMPKKSIVRLLAAAWQAFGAKGGTLRNNVTANFAQIGLESGGSPQQIQVCGGYVDINCTNGNPARGLFQFIPSTFNAWKVDGFNDIYNPLDNILAAVNAQVNSGMGYILNGSSGWGPGSGSNPYTKGGKAGAGLVNIDPSKTPTIKPHPYKGPPQTDAISRAVRSAASGASSCYVAYVKRWYDLIKKYPPQAAIGEMPEGVKRVFQPRRRARIPARYCVGSACTIDARILPNLIYLLRKYDMVVEQGWNGSPPSVSHNDGTGVDFLPRSNSDKGWDKVDAAARATGWTRGCAASGVAPACKLIPAFYGVFYTGYPNHGRGNHLHISWMAAPGPHWKDGVLVGPRKWVMIFGTSNIPGGPTGNLLGPASGSSGHIIRGRVSWFDDFTTASGIHASSRPGVALNLDPGTNEKGWNNKKTQKWIAAARAGKPFCAKVTVKGRTKVFPIIDLGPFQDTRRAIDISVPGILKMGFTKANFPTDSKGTAEIIGQGRKGRCR